MDWLDKMQRHSFQTLLAGKFKEDRYELLCKQSIILEKNCTLNELPGFFLCFSPLFNLYLISCETFAVINQPAKWSPNYFCTLNDPSIIGNFQQKDWRSKNKIKFKQFAKIGYYQLQNYDKLNIWPGFCHHHDHTN